MRIRLRFLPALLGALGLAAAEPEVAIKPYTLPTCVVSGEELGSMGEPVVINHEGQEIKFCCKGCIKKFNKDPGTFLKKLAAAPAEGKAEAKPEAKPAEAGAHDGHQH